MSRLSATALVEIACDATTILVVNTGVPASSSRFDQWATRRAFRAGASQVGARLLIHGTSAGIQALPLLESLQCRENVDIHHVIEHLGAQRCVDDQNSL